jgi:hypothetical protein
MTQRAFVQTTAADLAAEEETPVTRVWGNSPNPYVEPSAIEPITGVLPTFSPVAGGAMSGAFVAQYSLLAWIMALEKSENKPMGSMNVNFDKGLCRTLETRDGIGDTPACSIKTTVQLGKDNTESQWTLESQVEGRAHMRFIEEGVWDGKTATVKAKSFSRQYATANPLIHRWALLPLLESGSIKKKPHWFLICSTIPHYAQTSHCVTRARSRFQLRAEWLSSIVTLKRGMEFCRSIILWMEKVGATHHHCHDKLGIDRPIRHGLPRRNAWISF